MEVRVSGCVFSSLFIELANSKGDIDGFLFGEISTRTTKVVSDSQEVNVKHERVFAVEHLLVCQGLFSFYDGVGSIHSEKLEGILDNKKQNVLGWFRFRRNSRLQVSMREKTIHKNLLKHLNISQPQDFFFSVFTSSHEQTMSYYLFKYAACYYSKDSSIFRHIPIRIVNLGNTSQSEYKQHIEPTRSTSKQYQNIIGSFRDEFLDNVGQLQQVRHAHSMYSNMLGKLNGLAETVHNSETELQSLSVTVTSLREELKTQTQLRKGELNLIVLDGEEPEKEKEKEAEKEKEKPTGKEEEKEKGKEEKGKGKEEKGKGKEEKGKEKEENDLISFDEVDAGPAPSAERVVVTAKHIVPSIQNTSITQNSVSTAAVNDSVTQNSDNKPIKADPTILKPADIKNEEQNTEYSPSY